MPDITRRRFLAGTALGAAVGVFGNQTILGAPDAADGEPLIDAHTHFYDPTRPQGVPWPGKDDKLLYRRVLPADYRADPQPHKVTGTVVVEASPWVEDNQWLLDLAAGERFIVGVVGNLTPGDDDFARHLTRFGQDPLFRGIRIGSGLLKTGLEQPQFLDDLKRLAGHDLALDVNGGPDMLPDVARLAAAVPELRLVINHAANLRFDGVKVDAAWRDGMRQAAEHDRVFCKVSALVEGAAPAEGPAPRETDFYRPLLDTLWDVFGADRLIYASNWPVSERFAPLAAVQGITMDFVRTKGRQASENFAWRNSQAAYKWAPR